MPSRTYFYTHANVSSLSYTFLGGWAKNPFLEDVSPWVLPHELPTLLGPAFTLFDACEFTPTADGTDEEVAVALSPQGEVIFRAWLRRRGIDPGRCSS